MPRRSRYPVSKSASQGKGRRSRGKHQAVRPPAPVASGRINTSRNLPTASISSDSIKQTIPPQPYVIREIKRILTIAGVLLLILVILSIVL